VSTVSGSGCSAFDTSLITMHLPLSTGNPPAIGSPPYPCRDVTLYDFPTATDAAVMTLNWSLFTP